MKTRRAEFSPRKLSLKSPSRLAEELHRRSSRREIVTMRRSALSGVVLAAMLAGGCEQHSTSPAAASQSSTPVAVTGGSVVDQKIGSNWVSTKPSGASDQSRRGLSQTVRISSGRAVEISAVCAIDVYAKDQSHRRLDETERLMLDMRAPQGGLLISMDVASIAGKTTLMGDLAYANQQADLIRKNNPGSIIDTNGPVYQKLPARVDANYSSTDVSLIDNILRIPIVGPAMKGPTGEIGSQPYLALKDIVEKKNIEILVPMRSGEKYSFSLMSSNTKFWEYAESCYHSYGK